MVGKDGFTLRDSLQGLLQRSRDPRRRAEIEAQLACPPLPPSLDYLWRIFARLGSRRGSGGFGPTLISWLEMDAFQRLTGFRLTPWEIELIEMVDNLFLAEYARSRAAKD